ncbi:hypothetical protein [Ruminiclostridium josui]|uniref:hypothetical protein n=1 Tax=Ruminiclostridium josui TaxID=1499 RepID=UPI000467C112|nr:hypothetical protein [Ruminiclostridium josui]
MHENAHGKDNVSVGAGVGLSEHARWQPKWTIEKYNAEMKLYDTEQIEGNLLLNEGISSLLTLLIGGSETPFNNANAYIGVGDGTTEAAPNQTGLMGENKSFAPMDATFPQVSGNTVTFRATFGPTSGNHPWREFTISNGNSDTAKNLNRKVETAQRIKVEPDTWVIQLQVTIS